MYEDCLSYYTDLDENEKPLGFKGSASLLNIGEVHCEHRDSFHFRDKKLSRDKSEIYVLVIRLKRDDKDEGKMLLTADSNQELEEWKESLQLAVWQQTLHNQAESSEDKLPTADIEEVEEMLRKVEITADADAATSRVTFSK